MTLSRQWRNGNAGVCKTSMSRFDSGLLVQMRPWYIGSAPGFQPGDAGSIPVGRAIAGLVYGLCPGVPLQRKRFESASPRHYLEAGR